MSFAAADCLGASNPLLQFNKHNQQDRSLQHQHQHQNQPQNHQFKNDSSMLARDRANMDQFATNNAFQFQPMRHELNALQARHSGPTTGSPAASQAQWGAEFALLGVRLALIRDQPKVQGNVTGGSWGSEFSQSPSLQNGVQSPVQAAQSPQFQQNMGLQGGRYRPMMGSMGGMGGMGVTMGGMAHHNMQTATSSSPQVSEQNVTQAPDVDWDNQFKEIEEMEAKTAEAPAETAVEDEIVIDDKYQATFQEVWDGLNLDAMENSFINQQYEEFNNTRGQPLPADMAQWERDFAKYASTRAHFGDYHFEEKQQNQFLDMPADQDPYEIGLQLMESGAKLLEAALAFEAAIQRDETHVNAWLKLGEVQTQNEKEIAGISALEKCLELAPENLEALMTLAISYINEGYDNAAFATLERWISTKYPGVLDKARAQDPTIDDEDRFSLNKRVTELFLKAAQLSPTQANMDPDVQMGLGVLFYANEDFDKTIDCFKAALSIKPDDPVLWNRLGASLANLNRSEEAVDAYFKALELKPTFVRARYNLGVLCINIGCYKEAAEHLLSGLLMHQVEGMESGVNLNNNQSLSLMETLKRAFIALERRDLVDQVRPGMDLDQFRGDFNF